MTLIEWRDEFDIGIPSVDHEHRTLIDLINELHRNLSGTAPKETVLDFFGDIHAKISAHFALEEQVMREMSYDQHDDHKADHERLLDDIRDIMDAYAGYEGVLTDHLVAWFTNHFQTKDARLHRFLVASGRT